MDKRARNKFNTVRTQKHRPNNVEIDETTAVMRKATEIANQELTQNHKKPMNNGRKALIEQAMVAHQAKSHILDALDRKQRKKLRILAAKAFGRSIEE